MFCSVPTYLPRYRGRVHLLSITSPQRSHRVYTIVYNAINKYMDNSWETGKLFCKGSSELPETFIQAFTLIIFKALNFLLLKAQLPFITPSSNKNIKGGRGGSLLGKKKTRALFQLDPSKIGGFPVCLNIAQASAQSPILPSPSLSIFQGWIISPVSMQVQRRTASRRI